MVVTLDYLDIVNKTDELIKYIDASIEMNAYKEKHQALKDNKEAQGLIRDFNRVKEQYEEVQRFGSYHPEYNNIMKAVRSTKRKMDMNNYVAEFKIAERNMQNLLDETSKIIASSVSSSIKVPNEGHSTSSGCSSGGCGTGASCAC